MQASSSRKACVPWPPERATKPHLTPVEWRVGQSGQPTLLQREIKCSPVFGENLVRVPQGIVAAVIRSRREDQSAGTRMGGGQYVHEHPQGSLENRWDLTICTLRARGNANRLQLTPC